MVLTCCSRYGETAPRRGITNNEQLLTRPTAPTPSFQMHVDLALQIYKRFDPFRSGAWHHVLLQLHLLKTARPPIKSDVNSVHAHVSFSPLNRYGKSRIIVLLEIAAT
jgi:hypothetical protein